MFKCPHYSNVQCEHDTKWQSCKSRLRVLASAVSVSFRRMSGASTRVCGYAYVLHLTNVVLVQLFCAAILTLRVWFSAVRVQVQVEYALKARCENVRNWIFEWGFCIGGFCGWSLNRLFRISGLVESNLDYHNRRRSNSMCH